MTVFATLLAAAAQLDLLQTTNSYTVYTTLYTIKGQCGIHNKITYDDEK